MNRVIKMLVLIAGVSSMVAAGTAHAETSPSSGSTGIGSTVPTTGTSNLSTQEQGYVDMGASNAQQQVQTINANSTPPPVAIQGPQGGSAGSAKKSQTMQLIATGASVAAAGYLGTKCFAPTPEKWACPMFAMAVVQAGLSLASAGNSGQSAKEFSTGSGAGYGGTGVSGGGTPGNNMPGTMGTGTGTGSDGTNGGTQDPQQMAINSQMGKLVGEYQGLRANLERSGYKVSADGQTITDPSGKKIATSAFQSSGAAAGALGLTDAETQNMNEAMNAMNAKANDRVKGIAMAVEGGGGSGVVSNASGGGSSGRGGYGGGFNFRMPGQGGSQVKGVSGLSKQLGSDKIGIASDNIFEMIHHRYQERDKDGNFQKQ